MKVIGSVLGRPLTYREVPRELVRRRFIEVGLGAEFVDAYTALLAATLDEPALVTGDVAKVVGRRAAVFAQWVTQHRDLFTN